MLQAALRVLHRAFIFALSPARAIMGYLFSRAPLSVRATPRTVAGAATKPALRRKLDSLAPRGGAMPCAVDRSSAGIVGGADSVAFLCAADRARLGLSCQLLLKRVGSDAYFWFHETLEVRASSPSRRSSACASPAPNLTPHPPPRLF